jgi:hypothetical protein
MKQSYTQAYIFCIISSIALPVYSADDTVATSGGDPFFNLTKPWTDGVHVSRSNTQGSDYSKAASVAYSNDSSATAYYSIDASLGYVFGDFSNKGNPISLSGFMEEHKNSIASKKQDVVSGGLSFDGKYGDAVTGIQWQPKFSISAINDHGLDSKGWASLFALSGISKSWAMNSQNLNPSGVQWNWSPQIGIQHERATSTNTSSATRLFAMADVTFAPLSPWEKEGPDRQLSFTLSHKTVLQIHESGVLDTQQKNHHIDSISANWALSPSSKNNPVTLSLSRTIGSDPMESMDRKGVTELTMKFKI